jgi:hypothetical protein
MPSITATTQSQINRLAFLLRKWADRSLKLEGVTDAATRKNINNWLNDFETIYKREMEKIKKSSGLSGYSIATKDAKNIGAVNQISLSIEAFLDKYRLGLDATNNIDTTNIRNFRNSLGSRWKKNYKSFYAQWDAIINNPSAKSLTFNQLLKQVRNKPFYRDLVSIVDGSGRKWNPDSYSAMYSQTQASTYYDDVRTEELQDLGVEYIRISDHGTTTPICKQYEGKIFALSSNSLGVPVIKIRPPFHVGCKHFTLATRPSKAKTFNSNNKKVDSAFNKAKKDFPVNWKKTVNKQETYNLTHRKAV